MTTYHRDRSGRRCLRRGCSTHSCSTARSRHRLHLRVWVQVAAAARVTEGRRAAGYTRLHDVLHPQRAPHWPLSQGGRGGAPRGWRLTPAVWGSVWRARARAGRAACTEALLGRRTQHRVRSGSAPASVERVRCATPSSERDTHQPARMYVQRTPRCATARDRGGPNAGRWSGGTEPRGGTRDDCPRTAVAYGVRFLSRTPVRPHAATAMNLPLPIVASTAALHTSGVARLCRAVHREPLPSCRRGEPASRHHSKRAEARRLRPTGGNCARDGACGCRTTCGDGLAPVCTRGARTTSIWLPRDASYTRCSQRTQRRREVHDTNTHGLGSG